MILSRLNDSPHPLVAAHLDKDSPIYSIEVVPIIPSQTLTIRQESLALSSLIKQLNYGPHSAAPCSFLPSTTASETNSKAGADDRFTVQHLQPVTLYFSFPAGYPSQCPPVAAVRAPWVPATRYTAILDNLQELWEESAGMECMFSWVEWLRNDLVAFLADDEDTIRFSFPDLWFPKLQCSLHITTSKAKDTEGIFPVPPQCKTYVDTLPRSSSVIALEHAKSNFPGSVLCSFTSKFWEMEEATAASSAEAQQQAVVTAAESWRDVVIRAVTVTLRNMYENTLFLKAVRAHDEEKKEELFKQEQHSCDVCLDDVIGSNCHRLKAVSSFGVLVASHT